jgi:hypothetical protein
VNQETLNRLTLENDINMEKFNEKLHINNDIYPNKRNQIKQLIMEYESIFEYDNEKNGRIDLAKHKIITPPDAIPITQKRYRETKDKTEFISQEIDKLLRMGKIRESYSPWSSPVTLAGKKSGKYRFCIDYRKLNAITKPDAYPLPRIDELLEKYETSKWFTSLDLAAGYHQIEMEELDKEKTAFICSKGLYEYNVMPFGLRNAPGTFQRVMDKILKDYIDKFVVVYIDDIMIYSEDFESHITQLTKVLRRLRDNNLIVKLKKCRFAEENIEFLGHIIGKDGIKPDPNKINKITQLKPPVNVKGVRSVLGLCSYYRKFIKDFSKIAKPLTNLIKKDVKFEWNDTHQKAFDELKNKLVQYPILQHPNYKREFILITDSSGVGLGAVLSQKNNDNKEVVVAYASRTLNPTEQRYPITEQECLAVIWAIQHFHKFLIGGKFTVITDHAALKGLMNAKIPKGKRARWVMELQQYNFEIVHRAGKENKNADALSRLID